MISSSRLTCWPNPLLGQRAFDERPLLALQRRAQRPELLVELVRRVDPGLLHHLFQLDFVELLGQLLLDVRPALGGIVRLAS